MTKQSYAPSENASAGLQEKNVIFYTLFYNLFRARKPGEATDISLDGENVFQTRKTGEDETLDGENLLEESGTDNENASKISTTIFHNFNLVHWMLLWAPQAQSDKATIFTSTENHEIIAL